MNKLNFDKVGQPLIYDSDFHAVVKEIRDISLEQISHKSEEYPRENVERHHISEFTSLLKDGAKFDPIIVYNENNSYPILDGEHRRLAYKECGIENIPSVVVDLMGDSPLAISAYVQDTGLALTNKAAEKDARRLYESDKTITSAQLAKILHRSIRTIDNYIADLRAQYEVSQDIKILKMTRLGIPQDRIEEILSIPQSIISEHLSEMETLLKSINDKIERGLPINDVARQEYWPEPLVWALKLENKTDQARFKELNWGLRTYDDWSFNDRDKRFGDNYEGNIPAQLIAHTLFFFTQEGDLVFDPMAGGGVVSDTCLAFQRQCWSFDKFVNVNRPEIERFCWGIEKLEWPVKSKQKPDLIFFDAPYYIKKGKEYQALKGAESDIDVSALSREQYLEWFSKFFNLAASFSKPTTWLAFLNADWRDFQENTPACQENTSYSITCSDYERLMMESGWGKPFWISCPLSNARFTAGTVAAMQKTRKLGVVGRNLLVAKRQ